MTPVPGWVPFEQMAYRVTGSCLTVRTLVGGLQNLGTLIQHLGTLIQTWVHLLARFNTWVH
jgi:hypothetical protein